jgi:hypothetical protein
MLAMNTIEVVQTLREMALLALLRLVIALLGLIGRGLDLGEGEREAVLARIGAALNLEPWQGRMPA